MHAAVIFPLITVLSYGSRTESDSSVADFLRFFRSFSEEPQQKGSSPKMVEERDSLDSISLYEEIDLNNPRKLKSTNSASPFLETNSSPDSNKRLVAGASAFVIAATLAGVLMYMYL